MKWSAAFLLLFCIVLTLTGCAHNAAETAMPSATPVVAIVTMRTAAPVCTACPHDHWDDGVCADCRAACEHPAHDPSTGKCLTCGKTVWHRYTDGVCACGETFAFLSASLPEALCRPCAKRGTVESVAYETADYYGARSEKAADRIEKRMLVYLPYGYDAEKQYNVLVLLHGLGADENYWFMEPQTYNTGGGDPYTTATVLDNMIHDGVCEPLIVVAPTFYQDTAHKKNYNVKKYAGLFDEELRKAILPCVISRYATYATGVSDREMAAARAHFGYVGISMGSIIGFKSVLSKCLDLFGWIGCMSGFGADAQTVVEAMDSDAFCGYPIYYFYNSCGAKDTSYSRHLKGSRDITEMCDRLTDGKNAAFVEIPDAAHEYRVWVMGLYNCLSVFFR